MEARNRALPEWFNRIRTGQLLLPRFQRFEAWSQNEVSGLLETVLRGLPSGAALILEVGDREPFLSRAMVGAPAPTERVTEHPLDGQQRLTALWRSLHDDYTHRTYLVRFAPDDAHGGTEIPFVFGQSKSIKDGEIYPRWLAHPSELLKRGFIPLRLLSPEDMTQEVNAWCQRALSKDDDDFIDQWTKLTQRINDLRLRVTTYNLPFLSLSATTPGDVAVQVFIKMNTSSVRLTAFDIVVAQLEEATQQSLHDLIAGLRQRAPALEQYDVPQDVVLAAAALRQDRPAQEATYLRLDKRKLVEQWPSIVEGIGWAISFLEEERIFDGRRLPTSVVLPVLAAIHEVVPTALDALGSAKALLRKYLWRAFLTDRYENSVQGRALQDLRGLRAVIEKGESEAGIPIFQERDHPLPTKEEIMSASWPRGRDILARGLLAVSLRGGALDLADGTPVSREHLQKREYHHLFPDALLTKDGGFESWLSSTALNCALITWQTNRTISAKDPVRYLEERIERSVHGLPEVESRLATHAIPFKELNVGDYASIADDGARREKIRSDYVAFLSARADLLMSGITTLCEGRRWP